MSSWIAAILLAGAPFLYAADKPSPLPRSRPEAQGVSSAGLLDFVKAADEKIEALHSVMLLRHGQVVAEGWWTPYDASTRHQLYSLTKSFTSTAVGLAVAEGRITVDDPVLPRFGDDTPAEVSDFLKAMRVRDLLTMSTGHHNEAPFGPDQPWTRTFFAHPVAHKPGTFFLYNTPASNTLGALVEKATGTSLLDYLRPRLFEPLGIEDPVWSRNPQGAYIGGFGLSLRTEDVARFGQLYLQKGEWGGRRLLPAAWVETATSRQMSNGSKPESDWEQGYGYQFWRCRHGFYRGDGAFGQYCVVMPEKDAVLVITSGVKDMQSVLNLVWDKLVPALRDAPLPANEADEKTLATTLTRLTMKPQAGVAVPTVPAKVTAKPHVFPANDQKLEALALERDKKGDVTLVVKMAGAERRLACGRGEWRKGRLALGNQPEQAVAVSGAWTAPDTYAAKIAFVETPFVLSVALRFAGGQLFYDAEYNVAFGPTKQPQLIGS